MARRKQDTVHVPADKAEAEQMTGEYVSIEREMLEARLRAQRVIDTAKSDLATRLTELAVEQKGLFGGLKAWWEAGGGKEVAGRNRSTDMAGASIGIRRTPKSVKMARKVTAAAVVKWLQSLRWSQAKNFLRVKVSLDKQAIIKAAQEDPRIAKKFADKLTIVQSDEFFIDAGLDEDAIEKEIVSS